MVVLSDPTMGFLMAVQRAVSWDRLKDLTRVDNLEMKRVDQKDLMLAEPMAVVLAVEKAG